MNHPVRPVTITRPGAATDAEGRPAGPAPTVAAVDGLVIELSANERLQGGSLGQQTTAQALLPLGTDVQPQDRLATTFASGLARSYRVVAVHDCVVELLVDLHRDGS